MVSYLWARKVIRMHGGVCIVTALHPISTNPCRFFDYQWLWLEIAWSDLVLSILSGAAFSSDVLDNLTRARIQATTDC
jgi:hypothetical protein